MKDILKYSIWFGIYSVLVIPFIVADTMFFPYIVGKAFTFRIIVEIIFGLWLILFLKEKEFRPKWSWVMGSAIIFTLILLVADIFAVAPYKAFWSNYERMEGWVTFVHLMAYLLVVGSMFNTEKLWLWFLRANLFLGSILAIYGISKATEVRFSGPLGNPIYIAVYFLFIFFFTLILLYKDVLTKHLNDWKAFKKVFVNILFYVYLMASILSFYVVYRTSRGALLGAVGGIFIGAILIAIFEKERKVIRQIAIGGIAIVIAVVVVFLGAKNTNYVKNNPTLSRFAEISWSNVNGQARQLVWPMALKGFQEKPILGWGQEGFNYVFNKYYDPGMYGQEAWFDRAHNAPLDFLVAGGIIGLMSYLSLFGVAIYLLLFRKNVLSITERSLLTGLLFGYLFQAIFVFDNLVSYIMFFTTLAYIHSRLVEQAEAKKAFNYFSDIVSNEEYQNYIIIPTVIILIGVSIWWVNIPGIMANKTLIQSLQLTQGGQPILGLESFKKALSYKSMGDSEIREQLLSLVPSVLQSDKIDQKTKLDFYNLTITEVDKQISRVPEDARYYILMGSLLDNTGNTEQALTYINKAIELSPQKQTMRFELIQALYRLGRKEEALSEAKKAYELDTRFDQAKSYYEALLKEISVK
jgi:tetratricopeptide (TPR) repeat protein